MLSLQWARLAPMKCDVALRPLLFALPTRGVGCGFYRRLETVFSSVELLTSAELLQRRILSGRTLDGIWQKMAARLPAIRARPEETETLVPYPSHRLYDRRRLPGVNQKNAHPGAGICESPWSAPRKSSQRLRRRSLR